MCVNRVPVANRAGHTLIELLTVLVLVFVIASLAAPSMSDYLAKSRTRRALDRIANDIAFARMLAVREGTASAIDFSTGGYTVIVQTTPPETVRTVNLAADYPGITVTPPTTDGQLLFDSRGLIVSPQIGPIVAAHGELVDSAIVTASGRVYRDY